MRIKIIALMLLAAASGIALTEEYIGEAFNPCGDPWKLTATNYKDTQTGIIYNGKSYPVGFYFFYKTDNPQDMHKLWKSLIALVEKMADEAKIDASKKCDFSGTITYVDENKIAVEGK